MMMQLAVARYRIHRIAFVFRGRATFGAANASPERGRRIRGGSLGGNLNPSVASEPTALISLYFS